MLPHVWKIQETITHQKPSVSFLMCKYRELEIKVFQRSLVKYKKGLLKFLHLFFLTCHQFKYLGPVTSPVQIWGVNMVFKYQGEIKGSRCHCILVWLSVWLHIVCRYVGSLKKKGEKKTYIFHWQSEGQPQKHVGKWLCFQCVDHSIFIFILFIF